MSAPRLSRAALAAPGQGLARPDVRIVHIGAGAFHRAHQAWYTARATDAAAWGIAAFTGRSTDVVRRLAPQDGLYTLVERGPEHDRFEIVGSIAEVRAASDLQRFRTLVAAPATAVVTLTITEAGYRLRADGELDLEDPDVAADVAALVRDGSALRTPLARLLRGLEDRRRAHAGPLAVVPCDNLPANGERVRLALAALALASGLTDAAAEASVVTTSVDRITPHATAADLAAVTAETGWRDEGAVVTEPFSDWTLCGEFPGGRPAWESAGARFVDDIEPAVRRKLLLLNGGHLVLAFEGLRRECATVADAMRVRECRAALERFWEEADRACGGGNAAYRAQLVARFENPRIEHRLAQIAVDTVTKLRLRVLPVVRSERAAGRTAQGAAGVIAAWAACAREGRLSDAADPALAVAALAQAADERDAAFLAAAADGGR